MTDSTADCIGWLVIRAATAAVRAVEHLWPPYVECFVHAAVIYAERAEDKL